MPAAAPAGGPALVSPQPRSLPGLERAKQRLDGALPQPSRRRAAPRTATPTPPGVFGGLDVTTNAIYAGFTPSDSTGAKGPSDYVELVNSQIGVYDTGGSLVTGFPQDLQSFLIDKGLGALTAGTSSGDAGDQIFDVQVQWDAHWNRWLIASDDVLPNGDSRLVFGWSTTTDPAADWCLYTTDAGTDFDDFPKLGHDDDFLVIGVNRFANADGGAYEGSLVWGIPKPTSSDTGTLACGSRPALTELPLALGDFTPVPAGIADASATGYVVATSTVGSGSLRLYTVTNDAGTPKMSTTPALIPVGSWAPPPNVQQPGTAAVIDSQDGRLTQAVATTDPGTAHETIWTQHTVRSADGRRAEVRWYQLDGVAKTKLQEGSIADPSGSVFNAAISPTNDGSQAAIDYDVGGLFHLVQARAQTRVNATTPANTMQNEITLGSSTAVAGDFTCTQGGGPCRFGDYAGASPDPSSSTTTWGTNQLNGDTRPDAHPSWTTINFALTSGGPDLPPDTTADGFPFTTASTTPVFNFASSETGSTFQCSIDGGAFAACNPGATFGPPLPNGTHDFGVRAIDAAGQADPTPAHASFEIAVPSPAAPADAPPAAGTTTSPSQPKVAVSARRQRASRAWIVSVRVACPASRAAGCAGTVTLTSGRLELGSARFRVPPGRTATVRVRLGRRARAQLRKRRTLRTKATFRIASSPRQRAARTFTLLAPRRS